MTVAATVAGAAAADDVASGRSAGGPIGRGAAEREGDDAASTGSTGLLAVTVTASGLANAVPIAAVCGVLPATA